MQLKAEDEAVAASAAEAAEAQRLEEVMAARLEFAAAETAETEATKAAKAAEEAVLNSAAAVETAKGECKKVTDAWVNGGCSSTMKLAVEDAAANVTKKQYAADKADEARRTATRFAEEQKESRVLAHGCRPPDRWRRRSTTWRTHPALRVWRARLAGSRLQG